jgi:hypothetical protein
LTSGRRGALCANGFGPGVGSLAKARSASGTPVWLGQSAWCQPPSPRAPLPSPASKGAPHRADGRLSPSGGSPASPRNATGEPLSPSPPAAASPSLIDHPRSESEDRDRFSFLPTCHPKLSGSLEDAAEGGAQVELGGAKFAFGTTGFGATVAFGLRPQSGAKVALHSDSRSEHIRPERILTIGPMNGREAR